MRARRVARRLLDPWAGLLFAALIVLGVIILLATPGPWRVVGGPEAPLDLVAAPPSDVAAFIMAGPATAPCSAVVWLHVEHEPAAVTAILVPPQTRCMVAGGGYAPIRRLATDVEPEAAAAALGDALGVAFDGWMTLERAAVTRLFAAARKPGDEHWGLSDFRTAVKAFSLPADDAEALRKQQDALERSLQDLPLGELNVNGVVNYTLGSGDVVTDLDLRAASTLATTLASLNGRDIAVGTAAAIVETCGATRSWRLDESRLATLRLSLALGLKAPVSAPQIKIRARTAEVRVVAPALLDGEPFAEDLRAALLEGGARPVAVSAVSLGEEEAGERLAALVARRRPLAVVLVPSVVEPESPSAVAAELTAMTRSLNAWRQPAVVVRTLAAGAEELDDAIAESGLPVLELDGIAATPATSATPAISAPSATNATLFADDDASREAAYFAAAAVSRACWPAYLAPQLPGTRLEFSFAARRAATVALAGAPVAWPAPWLTSCGFAVVDDAGADWDAPAGPAIAYWPGARRAALALAGDLGWPPATVFRGPAAPTELTVVPVTD